MADPITTSCVLGIVASLAYGTAVLVSKVGRYQKADQVAQESLDRRKEHETQVALETPTPLEKLDELRNTAATLYQRIRDSEGKEREQALVDLDRILNKEADLLEQSFKESRPLDPEETAGVFNRIDRLLSELDRERPSSAGDGAVGDED